MGGLAAAHALNAVGYEVELYERQSYDEKLVNCGEALTASSLVPIEKTAENGFPNDVPAFDVEVFTGTDPSRRLVGAGSFPSADGYITDRSVVERTWATRLEADGVAIHDGQSVSKAEFESLTAEHDLVVDATGQPSLTSKVTGRSNEYSGFMTAVNADVDGDFGELYPNATMVLENYVGYAWAFPKTARRANVGIGWAQRDRPDDYTTAMQTTCERNGWPVPTRENANVAIIPQGPSLNPTRLYEPELGVVRVGDAAGIANRFSGKGVSQAVHSSYIMAKHAATDRLAEYPMALHRAMRPEYLLAHVVRGVLEARRPKLLGKILQATSGLDVEEADRVPRKVLIRLLRHPLLFARLCSSPSLLRRTYEAYTDQWEYRELRED
jgi:digeranylgeranylglycerophospholipid reductase